MIPTNTIRGVVQSAGDDINVIWWDIPLYGYTLNTRDDLIENNPDLVQRFVDATYKGIDWAMDNPEGAIDILGKYNPEIPRDVGLESLVEIFDTMYKPNASGKDLGVFDPARVQSGRDVIVDLYGIDEMPLDDLYTNQFVSP
jgi:NitT/TauT family transport system substrate-binding protein